jgi:hypothetical protein
VLPVLALRAVDAAREEGASLAAARFKVALPPPHTQLTVAVAASARVAAAPTALGRARAPKIQSVYASVKTIKPTRKADESTRE